VEEGIGRGAGEREFYLRVTKGSSSTNSLNDWKVSPYGNFFLDMVIGLGYIPFRNINVITVP